MSWSQHSLTSQERIFIRQSVEKFRSECKVIHHAHQELPCIIVQCFGTKDAAQCIDSYCERTMEKNWTTTLVCSICVCTNILSETLVYSDTEMIFDTCDTNSDRGIQGRLEQAFTRETHCNIGSAITAPWRV